MDRREAQNIHWNHYESLVDRWEHVFGSPGLPNPRLEAPDDGSDSALHCCHRLLVVSWRSEEVPVLETDSVLKEPVSSTCPSAGCPNQLAGCWPMEEQRKPRSIWFSVQKSTGGMNTHQSWTLRYGVLY